MKLSVAPKSTKLFLSAVAWKVLNKTGTFREWYLVIYTDLQPIALTQAMGFKHPKNRLSMASGWLDHLPFQAAFHCSAVCGFLHGF